MSKAASEKVLKRMENYLNSEAARAALDMHPQRVWMYHEDIANAFKDGYALVKNRRKKNSESMPELDIDFFRDVAKQAINAVLVYVLKPRTKADLVSSTSTYISFDQDRYIQAPFNALKKAGRELINAELPKNKRLTDHKAERGKEGSESALLSQGIQRLHSTKRSVGALQLLGAAEWASNSPTYAAFSETKELRDFVSKFGQVELEFKKGSYKGKNQVKYNPNTRISIHVKSHKENPSGDLTTDWKTVKPKLGKLLQQFIVDQGISDVKGSNSIAEDAKNHARYLVISALKAKGLRTSGVSKPVTRKPSTVGRKKSKPAGQKRNKYIAKVGYAKSKSATEQQGASLYRIMALINDKLPETVRKNMGSPRLENQTGRFADSVEITEVIQTPQGMPSFGYSYRKDPYSVYETISGSSRADSDRDPRKLIDASIREIAAGYALGRFYTRRV